MINIEDLTQDDVGKWVEYTPKNERGKIKSWNDSGIFVVYNCSDDWDTFYDYTAAHTRPEDLIFVEKCALCPNPSTAFCPFCVDEYDTAPTKVPTMYYCTDHYISVVENGHCCYGAEQLYGGMR